MLINCINKYDDSDAFVINPPAVLPSGSVIVYHDREYLIQAVYYDDTSGVIEYLVELRQSLKNLDGRLIELIKANRKLEAVKLVKEERGIGLKEAKDIVDELSDKMREAAANAVGQPRNWP